MIGDIPGADENSAWTNKTDEFEHFAGTYFGRDIPEWQKVVDRLALDGKVITIGPMRGRAWERDYTGDAISALCVRVAKLETQVYKPQERKRWWQR